MSTSDRGFASMNLKRHKEIASKGGKTAHAKGTAHEWTPEEAAIAGRKGGQKTAARKLLAKQTLAVKNVFDKLSST